VTEPLQASEAQLKAHFTEVANILTEMVDGSVDVQVLLDWNVSPVVATLGGEGSELIPRNRGGRVAVAPFLQISQGLWAWLSYREEWDHDRPVGRTRRFSFRSAGVTIYFGWKTDAYKPQMFRAEWSGWAKWNGQDLSFQAGEAGHPHWQFDALDSLPDEELAERATMLREIIEGDINGPVRDFAPQMANADIRDVVTNQKLSRIHFASAAAWWKSSPNNQHAHGPATTKELRIWLQQTLSYISVELSRLQAA